MANRINPLALQYRAFGAAREQALWRQEGWALTWEQWWQLWEPHWENRGRGARDLCMQRLDREQGWFLGNVEIAERIKYLGKTPRSREILSMSTAQRKIDKWRKK